MRRDQRLDKIIQMIEEESRLVETDDLVGYQEKVLLSAAILKRIVTDRMWESMPQEKLIELVDAMGSTLQFGCDLLAEVQKLAGITRKVAPMKDDDDDEY